MHSAVRFRVFFFFKQKTAYEFMPSLVGSEMCIRDRESAYPRPSVPAGWPRSAARSQCQYQGLCIGPAFAAGIFRKPPGGGTARFQKQTPRLRLPESQSRAPRTQSQLLPVFCPDKRKGHSCPESSPVLRFDLFKFLVDDLLYPQRLPVEMGQFARTFQPRLARPSTSLGELFFDCLRHVLAQRNSQCTGGGLGLAEGGVRDFQRSLHTASIPYLWDSRWRDSPERAGRVRVLHGVCCQTVSARLRPQ